MVDRDQLDRGFRRLPPEQRAIFVFHHYLGLTLGEVAEQLGVPLGTVKSRLHYATNATGAPDAMGTSTEGFIAPGQTILVSAWSEAVAPGTTAEAWTVSYCLKIEVTATDTVPCDRLGPGGPRLVPVTVDGHAGSLVSFTEDTQAFLLVGNTMYVVACWRPESDPSVTPYLGASRLLEGYLSTMHLLPGGPAPSPTLRAT